MAGTKRISRRKTRADRPQSQREILRHSLHLDGEEIPLVLKPTWNARRCTLRVCRQGGEVRVTFPPDYSQEAALRFVAKNDAFIRTQLKKVPSPVPFEPGREIPVLGQATRLSALPETARTAVLHDPAGHTLSAKGEGARFAFRIERWLKQEGRRQMDALAVQYAEQVDRPRPKLSLRDPRSRWGSCSSSGGLSLSWRLVLAPYEVMRYVVAHEVAHLVHFNHSPAFWAVVDDLVPDRLEAEHWLKQDGNRLHAYGRVDDKQAAANASKTSGTTCAAKPEQYSLF